MKNATKTQKDMIAAIKTAFEVSKNSVENHRDRLAYIAGYISEKHPEMADLLLEIHSNVRWG